MAVLEELDDELPVPPEDEPVEMEVTVPEVSTCVSCEGQRTWLMAASVQVKASVQAAVLDYRHCFRGRASACL